MEGHMRKFGEKYLMPNSIKNFGDTLNKNKICAKVLKSCAQILKKSKGVSNRTAKTRLIECVIVYAFLGSGVVGLWKNCMT